MREILYELQGEKEDFKFLTSFLITGDWTITEREGKSFLKTSISKTIGEVSVIRDIGLNFLEKLNGAAKLIYLGFQKIEISSIYFQKEGVEEHIILIDVKIKHREGKMPVPILSKYEGNESELPIQTILEYYLMKANNNQSVKDALHFFNDVTWFNLYKVFEIIRDDVGGPNKIEKLYEKKWIKTFTQAAQSRELLGDNARHAAKKYKVPDTELSIYDAHKIIRGIFHNWILEKKTT